MSHNLYGGKLGCLQELENQQLDVRLVFLNGNLVVKKFMLEPIGFEVHGK
jgi:hypothetical protein